MRIKKESLSKKEICEYFDAKTNDPEKFKKEFIKIIKLNKSGVLGKSTKCLWLCQECKATSVKTISQKELRDCIYCQGKKVLPGFNSLYDYCLQNDRTEILLEWIDEKSPSSLTYKSNKEIRLKCFLNHEWTTTPKKRVNNKVGCPYCSNQKILKGFNDLATKLKESSQKEVLKYWSNKNAIESSDVFKNNKSWWDCYECKEPLFIQNNKMYLGRLCTKCRNKSKSSLLERNILEFLMGEYPNITFEENVRFKNYFTLELDIYIPEKKLGIEVNGEYWHSARTWQKSAKKKIDCGYLTSEQYHQEKKDYFLKEHGIKIAYLWEKDWLENNAQIKRDIDRFINLGETTQRLERLG